MSIKNTNAWTACVVIRNQVDALRWAMDQGTVERDDIETLQGVIEMVEPYANAGELIFKHFLSENGPVVTDEDYMKEMTITGRRVDEHFFVGLRMDLQNVSCSLEALRELVTKAKEIVRDAEPHLDQLQHF